MGIVPEGQVLTQDAAGFCAAVHKIEAVYGTCGRMAMQTPFDREQVQTLYGTESA